MNSLRPFSPPGNPPVRPNSSFSNAFSGIPSTIDGAVVVLSAFSSVLALIFGGFWSFLSSSIRPASPLHKPLPPKSSYRLNFAEIGLIDAVLGCLEGINL
uniref:Uncharacterized protein n=1 Tax=Opuntia streptacantha TaxID=393608 RepID=A0A7C9ETQ9_OPUST